MISDDEVYYIMDGNRYLTNNNVKGSGGTPAFKEVAEPKAAQEWKITVDASGKNCYKVTSNADGRYLNEHGVFGTNQYYSDWNSYLLTVMGDMWSLLWTQSAAKNGAQYIVVSGDRLEAKNIARSESYTVKIVGKNGASGINGITDKCKGISVSDGKITAPDDTRFIVIYSIDGKEIKRSNGNTIGTAGIAEGMYLIVTGDESNTYRQKVILD